MTMCRALPHCVPSTAHSQICGAFLLSVLSAMQIFNFEPVSSSMHSGCCCTPHSRTSRNVSSFQRMSDLVAEPSSSKQLLAV